MTSEYQNPMDQELTDGDEPSIVSVDRRWLSPDIVQEIVILAGSSWQIWLSETGDIIAANKGATA